MTSARTGRTTIVLRPGQITTVLYASRHIGPYVSTAEWANISHLAAADESNTGRIRNFTNFDLALKRGKSERTVRKQTARLVQDGRWIQRTGWTWVIVGYREHDTRVCEHEECRISAIKPVDPARAADELLVLRRKRDAERKRLARAAARAGQQGGGRAG